MQLQGREGERNQRVHSSRHVASPDIWLPQPIAEASRLSDAAPDIRQCQPSNKHIVVLTKNKKRIGLIGTLVLRITLEATTEGAAREIVRGPCRLPRNQKSPALFAQRRPLAVIGHLRWAEQHTVALDRGRVLGHVDSAEERHGRIRALYLSHRC